MSNPAPRTTPPTRSTRVAPVADPAPTPSRPTETAPGSIRAWSVTAGLTGVVAAGVTMIMSLSPESDPLSRPEQTLLGRFLPLGAITAVVVVAALVGLVVAAGTLRGRTVPRGLAVVALAEVLLFGVALQSVTAISLTGYLVAMALPLGVVVLVVGVVRRYRRLRWPVLLAVAGSLGLGWWSGALHPDRLTVLGRELAGGFARAGSTLLITVLFLLVAGGWAVILVRLVDATAGGRRLTAAVTRRRRAWTVVAAVCALPYGLIRLTWLTPWPLLSPGAAELTPETRLWGLLLGGGALLGCTLTLGLIRPWGERFPRWMPRLAGRPVPVRLPVVAGGTVAAVVCASALPMLVQLTFTGGGTALGISDLGLRIGVAFVFPFWLWGPALALAVWGYVGHRRGLPDTRPADKM